MATKGLTRAEVSKTLETAKGKDRVTFAGMLGERDRARADFFNAMRTAAGSAWFNIVSWGTPGIQVRTDFMKEYEILDLIILGGKEGSRYVWALVEKEFIPGVGLSSCDPLDEDIISRVQLTQEQVHFLNWTLTWYNRIDSFWQEGGTLEDHDDFLKNCQEDPDIVYQGPSPLVKSANKV
jgi:hypothetical protein